VLKLTLPFHCASPACQKARLRGEKRFGRDWKERRTTGRHVELNRSLV